VHRRSIAGRPVMDGVEITNFTVGQIILCAQGLLRAEKQRERERERKWPSELRVNPRLPRSTFSPLFTRTIRLHCFCPLGFHARALKDRNDRRGHHRWERCVSAATAALTLPRLAQPSSGNRKSALSNSIRSSPCYIHIIYIYIYIYI